MGYDDVSIKEAQGSYEPVSMTYSSLSLSREWNLQYYWHVDHLTTLATNYN